MKDYNDVRQADKQEVDLSKLIIKNNKQRTLHNTIHIETTNPYKDNAINFYNKVIAGR